MATELNVIIRDIVKDTLKKSAPGISETMRQAIAKSLTMKLAAAIMVPKARPFYGAECPSYPDCNGGCGLGCTHKIESAKRADGEAGMAWWNGLSDDERTQWAEKAGNTGVAADAWEAFKRQRNAEGADARS